MKLMLKLDAKPIKNLPYRLNLRIKEKVKKEIENMLVIGLIFLVDEAEWVSLFVIQNKKYAIEIWVYVDYRNLNNACVHDPFPTPFSDEVIDNVVGNEAYAFTYGFYGYHQIRITKEDKNKTTFTI